MNYSVLSDRLLTYDGKSIVEPEDVGKLLLAGLTPDCIISTETSEEIELFNSMSDSPILIFDENRETELDFSWQIPQEYLDIDLVQYFTKFITPQNESRILEELDLVLKLKIENEFRTIIYVVDRLKEEKIVFGVGRGSACACYLLFCIDIHLVDCIKYNIPSSEFFH